MPFLKKSLGFLFLLLLSFSYSQNDKPNILVIVADDMGIDITNGYQNNALMPTTPTLDSLRARGLTFKNAWAAPSCTPTRASIISGKYGIKTGVMSVPGNLDLSHTSVFNRLSTNTNDAYAKAVIGKWHINDTNDFSHPQQHGVDHYEGVFRGGVNNYFNWDKVTNGTSSNETEYVTTNFTNAAIDWLNNQDQEQPWLLWLAHIAPHTPFHVPPDGLYTIANTDTNLNKYVAAIEAMDHEIGRLLHNLDEDTRDNTIVIFIGDNGTPGQVAQFFDRTHAKGSLYEGGVRVPMIVAGKGVSRINEQEERLTQVLDIHATILELAGTPLKGGINNSLSFKPYLNCATVTSPRDFIYSDYRDRRGVLEWAIRNNEYKLIENENGNQEFYNIIDDLKEENNLIGSLTTAQQEIFSGFVAQTNTIRTGWSCNDGISNGEETEIDDCNINCANLNSTSTENIGCCAVPLEPNAYFEYLKDNKRNIYSNNFPDHEYCYNSPSQMPEQTYHHFGVDEAPQISGTITQIVNLNGRPARFFGVAKNGVILAPAPARPFIFENPNTGEFNWDWVFEPTNNQGSGMDLVGLDCASGHTGPQGYHYHGNMFEYLENIQPGITTTSSVPDEIIHIGWAADGFPIVYRFGADPDGTVKELLPSYQLKQGERPGDGIAEPCGEYNGKYTNDYEYICGKGDLDECNGINANLTLTTAAGTETFNYFYVISSSFPQIPRCLVGNVSPDFDNSSTQPTGDDNDNDGFIDQFDCDDSNASINPSVNGQSPVLDNCNPLSTANHNFKDQHYHIGPNPSEGDLTIISKENDSFNVEIYDLNSRLVLQQTAKNNLQIKQLTPGLYIVKVNGENGKKMTRKIIVK